MSMLRVIGGAAARRKLKAPRSGEVRPTTDRVKETLFNILGETVIDSGFLDLYAGSGSVGLEALSRGAGRVALVDHSPAAIRCIRDNLATLQLVGAEVIRARLPGGLRTVSFAGAPYDLVFLDPPYGTDLVVSTVEILTECPTLAAPDCRLIIQHESQRPLPEQLGGYRPFRQRVVGSTTLTFLSR